MHALRYGDLGPVLAVVAVALVAALCVGLRTWERADRGTAVRRTAAVLLLGAVAVVLLVSVGPVVSAYGIGDPARVANVHPLRGIRQQWHNPDQGLAWANLAGNVLLYLPLGLLGPLVAPRRPWLWLVGAGGLSLVLELVQYVLGRAADVDDVLLNTTGAALGLVVSLALTGRRRRGRGAT